MEKKKDRRSFYSTNFNGKCTVLISTLTVQSKPKGMKEELRVD